ncbi:MAG TPA: hypothetical protein VNM90_09030 [Haliangium sp.]|nr:hypothetical protein [Haliangium sp.]
MILSILFWAGAWPAAAEAQPGRTAAPEAAPDSGPSPGAVRVTSLDGTYLALGPIAAFVRQDGKWDGGFGGEISVVRVREREPLAALGLSVGALLLAEDDRGRLWGEILVGSRLAGIHVGLGAGGGVEVDAVQGRGAGHATVWIFTGVVPYARVGVVEEVGAFAEIGLKIGLPAVEF